MRARVRERRPAQRQAKGKRENEYVIKVMRLNREGGAVPLNRLQVIFLIMNNEDEDDITCMYVVCCM